MDPIKARATFEKICSQCHALGEVDQSPPRTPTEVHALIQRMSKNGMQASAQEVQLIQFHLMQTYGRAP